jgi:predicted RNA binding protein YcfA (HicA-like mRNA interferase family)
MTSHRHVAVGTEAKIAPEKRELIADREAAGFVDRGGKGSYRNFVHPKVAPGDDIERSRRRRQTVPSAAVQLAIEESKK